MFAILSLSLVLSLSSANVDVDATPLQFSDSTYSSTDTHDIDDYCADQVGEMDEPDSLDVARCHEYDPTTYPLPTVSARSLIAPAAIAFASISCPD
jgi:hypothetical protein